MKNKFLLPGLGLAVVLMLAATGAWIATQPYAFHGSVIEPASRAPDFSLIAQNGKPFRLSEQSGNVVLLFFGYTSCPDVCPTTLMEFKRVLARLPRETNHVQVVFITVDPERDTPDKLRAYLNAFDPSFTGLTGTMAELEPVWRAYGVYREKQPGPSPDAYIVNHSSSVYVVDKNGNLRLTYSFGDTADDMAQDVNYLIGEIHTASSTLDDSNIAGGSATIGNLKIENAWARPASAGLTGGVYLSITNTGTQADTLLSAQSPVAQTTEIHQTTMEGGIAKMAPANRIDVSAGQKIEFKPGGYHIMLNGLTKNLARGDRVPLVLTFERAGAVQIQVAVIDQ